MKNLNQRLLKGAIVFAMAVVISSAIFSILAICDVLPANPFKLGFAILSFGIGAIFVIYGLVTKGGYELAVGYLLLVVGTVIALIGALKWYGIVIIALAMLVVGLFALMLLKGNSLLVERTDERPDFKPYSEVLAEKKAEDAIKEAQPLPTLKDYSKED